MVCAVREAAQVAPSVLFLPNLQLWAGDGWSAIRTALWAALDQLPLSVLLLATCESPLAELVNNRPFQSRAQYRGLLTQGSSADRRPRQLVCWRGTA